MGRMESSRCSSGNSSSIDEENLKGVQDLTIDIQRLSVGRFQRHQREPSWSPDPLQLYKTSCRKLFICEQDFKI